MNKWKDIWNRKKIDKENFVLNDLIKADGFDYGGGTIEHDEWIKFVYSIEHFLSMKNGESVFELGCGSGAFLYPFYLNNYTVGGIDYSAPLIEIARKVFNSKNFEECEAKNLDTSLKYDYVIAHSVFHYFPDYEYSMLVIEKMLEKSLKKVAILELPNIDLKEQTERTRREGMPSGEYEKKYQGLEHLYYSKSFFEKIANTFNYQVKIFDKNIENYGYNGLRFNVIIDKNG